MDLLLPRPSSSSPSPIQLVDSFRGHVFRRDINGLRALAVVAVVLYHFGIPGFSGGFIGVDVFFVISGYLMTGIVLTGLAAGTFSLSGFYLARVKRIVPALLALCLVLLVVAWFLPLTGSEYQTMARHVRDSLLFLANRTYSREAGYFDTAAHEKWLLHTWSLSVEWQSYLILPLVLLAAQRWLKRPQQPGRLLLGLCLVSLALCVDQTAHNPTEAFYGLTFRAWEMLAGGLAYLHAPRWAGLRSMHRKLLSLVGLLIVGGCFALFDSTDIWPGWRAAVPVLATVLILAVQYEEVWLLANPVAQWLGARSYSIYLWHWPLVVALGLYGWQANPWASVVAILLSVGGGELSYRWVEVPTRRWKAVASRPWWLVSGISLLAVAGPAEWISESGAQLNRYRPLPASVQLLEQETRNQGARGGECHVSSTGMPPTCDYGGRGTRAIVVGDSHASTTVSAVAASVANRDGGIRAWNYNGCPIVFDAIRTGQDTGFTCAAFNDFVRRQVARVDAQVPLVIVTRASKYPIGDLPGENRHAGQPLVELNGVPTSAPSAFLAAYRRRLIDTACHYARQRPVYYVKPIPEFSISIPNVMARNLMRYGTSGPVPTLPLADYYRRHAFVLDALNEARERCGIHLLDPVPYLCPNGLCMSAYRGRPLYYDNTHLNEYGNRFLVPMFREVFATRS